MIKHKTRVPQVLLPVGQVLPLVKDTISPVFRARATNKSALESSIVPQQSFNQRISSTPNNEISVVVIREGDYAEDIDFEDTNTPSSCSVYANECFSYLHDLDIRWSLKPNFLAQQISVTPKHRAYTVDFLVNLHSQLCSLYTLPLELETLYCAVGIFDRFLSVRMCSVENLHLVALASFLIASKFEESFYPAVEHMLRFAPSTIRKTEVLKMEAVILDALHFKLGSPTPFRFLRRYAKAARADQTVGMLARFLCEYSLTCYSLVSNYTSSLIAAACISHALRIANKPAWTATLQRYSGHEHHDIVKCMQDMRVLVRRAPLLKTQAVYRKYAQSKYLKISVRACTSI
ncbi:putative G2/mitotic-specific cyclin-B2 [Blattamonas nauphoetae]|uniref:G2/mitotic-specific cyclin-B2 n=1 Tax=Blattamonas nauphoetae TaxID=2049346 RepID=A0ABQ9X899_9EUKA|nr:putative G2/mitotic-specific cyclin-B2 [Blattamonas nauphoetae]